MKPLLAVVIGDPGGIGPEVCVKALADARLGEGGDFVLIGGLGVIERAARACEIGARFRSVASAAGAHEAGIYLCDRAGVAACEHAEGVQHGCAARQRHGPVISAVMPFRAFWYRQRQA